jgi:deoxyadenosine/deoxycytidine kinase
MFRIEIFGGIATGKTTLAQRLAEAGGIPLIRESYREVPFWEKFYANPAIYEFEKNVSFLLFHADAIRVAESSINGSVCDFAFLQDVAYASLSRQRGDVPILEAIHAHLTRRMSSPSLLIRLKCTVDTQIERIRRRGRVPELSIGPPYLDALNEAVDARQAEFLAANSVPLIEVDTDEINFVDDLQHVQALHQRAMREIGVSASEP